MIVIFLIVEPLSRTLYSTLYGYTVHKAMIVIFKVILYADVIISIYIYIYIYRGLQPRTIQAAFLSYLEKLWFKADVD